MQVALFFCLLLPNSSYGTATVVEVEFHRLLSFGLMWSVSWVASLMGQVSPHLSFGVTVLVILILVILFFYFHHSRSLRLARNQSVILNELNEIIIKKNQEIELINKGLDSKLESANSMLYESQRIAQLGSWEYKSATEELSWTEETYRQLGLAPHTEKPSFELLRRFVSDRDYKKMGSALMRTIKTRERQTEDIEIQTIQGERRYIRVEYFPELVKNQVVRVFGTNQDITDSIERERHEKNIIKSLLELSSYANLKHFDFDIFIEYLLRQSTKTLGADRAIFWLYDENNRLLDCYKAYDRRTSSVQVFHPVNLDELPKFFESVVFNRTQAIEAFGDNVLQSGFGQGYLLPNNISSALYARVQLEGEVIGVFSFEKCGRPYHWTLSDQRYAGSITDIIATAFSTYQNRKLEREKETLIEKLIKKNQNLEELAYVISHNLRGPATQIIGLSELYGDPQSASIRKEIIERIHGSSIDLDRVIRDLSEVLKQQSNDRDVVERFDLKTMIQEVIEQAKENNRETSVNLRTSFQEGSPVFGSRALYRNIISTLVNNAFQYCREGHILQLEVGVSFRNDSLILTVTDNGVGIDLSRYEHKMFRMYQRFHPQVEGSGIGLFIVKGQVEMIGGTIEVSSKPGQGTSFTIQLPNSPKAQEHRQVSVEGA
ncbi:MAG: HAMP domain-containing sensor histidine kinase [Bacteroidota bacterium]